MRRPTRSPVRRPIDAFLSVAALLTVAALLGACGDVRYPPPPSTLVDPVVDTIHGVTFTDPYRWLEDQEAPETRAWIAEQNAYTERVVGSFPLRDSIAERYRRLVDVPDVGRVQTEGDWQYFSMRAPGQELPVVYRRPAADSIDGDPSIGDPYEVVLDPADFDPSYRTQVSLSSFAPDGRLFLYQVREGGSDEVEVRLRDAETLGDLPDFLPRALYGGVRFIDDGTALEYTHRSRQIGPRIMRHVIGTGLDEDRVVWGEGFGPETFIGTRVVGGRWRLFTAQHGWARDEIHIQDGNGPIRPVVTGVDAHFDVDFQDGALYITTDWRAPRARLVRVDPARPDTSAWVTILPEAELPLADVSFIEGRIYARYIDDVAHRVRIFEMDGTPAGEIDVPPYSSVSLSDADGEGKIRLTVEGYLRPEVEYEIDLATGTRTATDSSDIVWDASPYRVEQRWFTSADGTRGPVYVISRSDIDLDGSHPTILTGYGGFDVASLPGFSTATATWLDLGGVWAVATLRGGSEYGEEWHRGGMLENKQRVFDDFIAASELLVELGYTSPDHLGIWGSSNGGLLVAAALTQRPELYRAVYCGYPDLDMVRFNTFTENNNMPALLEYGDAANPEHFEAIRRYSPYQAVADGVDYPAVLLTTGDLDTRVPPLQARKMTARLQAATSSGLPVVLWYDEYGGHAANRGRPMSLRIEDTARELAFMGWQLGMEGAPPR